MGNPAVFAAMAVLRDIRGALKVIVFAWGRIELWGRFTRKGGKVSQRFGPLLGEIGRDFPVLLNNRNLQRCKGAYESAWILALVTSRCRSFANCESGYFLISVVGRPCQFCGAHIVP